MVRARGAEVISRLPVLRRANQSPARFAAMVASAALSVPRIVRLVRQSAPDVVYVNTVTLPWWLLAARLAGSPRSATCTRRRTPTRQVVRRALMSPLRLADAVIVISRSAMTAMLEAERGLRNRAHLIYNGVPTAADGAEPSPARPRTGWWSLVGCPPEGSARGAGRGWTLRAARLRRPDHPGRDGLRGLRMVRPRARGSGRKARSRGAGRLRRLLQADLACAGAVRHRRRAVSARALRERGCRGADVLRPVVAAAALGHLESIADRETGLLVPPSRWRQRPRRSPS